MYIVFNAQCKGDFNAERVQDFLNGGAKLIPCLEGKADGGEKESSSMDCGLV